VDVVVVDVPTSDVFSILHITLPLIRVVSFQIKSSVRDGHEGAVPPQAVPHHEEGPHEVDLDAETQVGRGLRDGQSEEGRVYKARKREAISVEYKLCCEKNTFSSKCDFSKYAYPSTFYN
jgi:hypothetical protein